MASKQFLDPSKQYANIQNLDSKLVWRTDKYNSLSEVNPYFTIDDFPEVIGYGKHLFSIGISGQELVYNSDVLF